MNIEALLNLIFVIGTLLVTLIVGLIKIKSFKGRFTLTVIILIPTIIFIFSFLAPESVFGRESIQSFILRFGIFSVLALILFQILQVIIPPFDHNVTQFIGGFLFGPWLGFLYNYIGRILGSILAFLIAKKYGRPFLKKVIPESQIKKYDKIWNKNLAYVFASYVFPFFPDDTVSYLAGVSKVNLRTFILMLILGHPTGVLGTTLAGSLGETLWFKNPVFWIAGFSTLLIGLIVFRSKNIRYKLLKVSE